MDSDGYGKNVKVVEDKKDEDIDIDFSKVKKWFSGKKKALNEESDENKEKPSEQSDEEEVSVDFTKVKKWLSNKDDEIEVKESSHTHPHEGESKEEHDRKTHEEEKKHDDLTVHDHDHSKPVSHEPKPVAHATAPEKKSEPVKDEVEEGEIDFSKVTSIFKRKKGEKKEANDDDVEFDLSGSVKTVTDIFSGESSVPLSRYAFLLIVIAGIAFSVWLGVSIRMEAGNLGFTDAWAQNSVQQAMQNDLNGYYSSEFPQLSDQARQQAVNEDLARAFESNQYTFRGGSFAGQTIDVRQQLDATSNQFKAFFQYDEAKGYNYMPDIDPYYWYRFARNKVETGQVGDDVRDGRQYTTAQLAPVGRHMLPQDLFYPRSMVWFFSFIQIFDSDADLLRTVMLYPVFIMALTIAVTFLLARRIAGNIAGFFAATMIAIHPALITRTLFGHADSDSIVVFMSVFVLWLFVESFMAKRMSIRIIFAALAGIATWVYSLTWGGYWWIFDFILAASLASIGLYTVYEAFRNTRNFSVSGYISNVFKVVKGKAVRKEITSIGVYYIVAGIFVSTSWGLRSFILTPITSLGFTSIKTPVVENAFPNVLRTVAELNEGSVNQAINQLGQPLFVIAVIGIILIMIRAIITMIWSSDNKNKIITDIFTVIILVMWLVVTMYSVTKGIRFVLLIVPAFSIAFGVVFGILADYVSSYISKEFKFNKVIALTVLFIVFAFVFVQLDEKNGLTNTSRNAANNDVPIVNDAWYNSLTAIRDNSEEDAIITSWWDFGHHFKAISERSVTFDGTTQNTPQAHWVGRLLMTGDEQESVGILRMLNCGANSATEQLQAEFDDPVKAVLFTKQIILMDREQARAALEGEGISDESIAAILESTHCDPPQSFVIASEDMIGKSGVWGHFGGWNFTRADIWKEVNNEDEETAVSYMMDQHGISQEHATQLFGEMQGVRENPDVDRAADAWISPWPGISTDVQGCGMDGTTVRCADGLSVNLTNNNAWFPTQQGDLHPQSIIILAPDGEVIKREFTEDVIPQGLSAIIIPQGDAYIRLIASPQLVDSLYVKMFFAQGHGLKHFSLLSRQQGFTGNDIYVWEVDWEGLQSNSLSVSEVAQGIPATPTEESIDSDSSMEHDAMDSMEHNDSMESNASMGMEHNASMEAMEVLTIEPGSDVTLQYIGYFADGNVFDSSIQEPGVTNETAFEEGLNYRDLTFTAGTGVVIPGFDQGLMGLAIGEEKQIEVPPELGYTQPGHPLNGQTLYFRVRIDNIQ